MDMINLLLFRSYSRFLLVIAISKQQQRKKDNDGLIEVVLLFEVDAVTIYLIHFIFLFFLSLTQWSWIVTVKLKISE